MRAYNITISTNDKLTLISNLSTMLAAGISLLEAIDSLLEDAKGNQKKLLTYLREDIMQGKHVYQSLSEFPQIFDKVIINIIKASEEAGTLDTALKDLRAHILKETAFVDKVKAALVYPIFIMVVFIGVLLMILIVVIPKISVVFLRLRVELPLPTRILIFLSDLLIHNTIPLIIGLALSMGLLTFIYRKQKRRFLNALFGLPLISSLIREIDLTRFTRSLYLLLSSGIPITSALELSQEVVLRYDVSQVIRHTREVVLSGKRMSEGLRVKKGIVPNVMLKIIEAGEKSGSLDKSMQDIAEYLDYQVSKSLQTATALLEPIMLVFVGLFVGGMMLAIIAPIYGLIGQVGNR